MFIVDDSEVVRERLAEQLSQLVGVELVGSADSASAAVRLIGELRPDAVILDLGLPDASGIVVLEQVKRLQPAPLVVVLTNYPHEEYRRQCLALGADTFLDKSSEFDHVPAALNTSAPRVALPAENSYGLMLDQMRDAVFQTDVQGRWTFLSRSWTEITGFDVAACLGEPVLAFVHPEDRPAARQSLERLLQEEIEDCRSEYRCVAHDGAVRWIEMSSRAARDAVGSITGTVGSVRDISRRRAAEQRLREHDERLRESQEAAHVGTWEWNIAADEMIWTDELYRIFGVDKTDVALTYETYLNRIPVAERRNVERIVARALETGAPFQLDHTVVDATGVTRSVHARGTVVLDAAGHPVTMRGIAIDITDRKAAEQRVEASERRFRALAEHARDAVALIGADGTILYGSPSTTRILGYALDEFVGRNACDVIHPDYHKAVAERLQQAVRQPGKQVSAEAQVRHHNGTWRRLEGALTNLTDDPAIGAIVANYHDVTERRLLQDQLHQAQKMEAVGQLASGVAHDFNNLLTAITGYGELILMDLPREHAARADLEEVLRAAQRAAGLTRQLLAFSRKEVVEPRALDLNIVVAGTEKMLRRLIGEDIQLRCVLEPEIGIVKADQGQMEQILMNIAVNARDAMPKGGKLTIETANVALDETYCLTHYGVVPGRYVRLAITDDGVGMTRETMAHIFEPFFTTKEPGRGTGLGLATVYGIVKQSNGHIAVYSEPACGTTFKVHIPRVDDVADAQRDESQASGRLHGTETILLVEDDESVRRIACGILERYGYEVFQAAHCAEARRIVETHPGPIQLLLTDVVLPNKTGPEIAEGVRQLRPATRVLYMSGYTDETVVRHGLLDNSSAYIQKPFTPEALVAKVRAVLSDATVAE